MSDTPALSRTGVRGLGFHVLDVGDDETNCRLYATANWSEDGKQKTKIRSISIRGIPRAAQRIAEVLIENHPSHKDKDLEEMSQVCREALRDLIMKIHEEDFYPIDSGRVGTGKRLQAVHRFVEHSPLLPPD